jgi:hypothetical protein
MEVLDVHYLAETDVVVSGGDWICDLYIRLRGNGKPKYFSDNKSNDKRRDDTGNAIRHHCASASTHARWQYGR